MHNPCACTHLMIMFFWVPGRKMESTAQLTQLNCSACWAGARACDWMPADAAWGVTAYRTRTDTARTRDPTHVKTPTHVTFPPPS